MANKFPLIFDTTDGNRIKELPTGDNLNLQGSSIVDAINISATGTIQANSLAVNSITINNNPIATVARTGNYNDLLNRPVIFSGDFNDLTNKPNIFSGSYNDLSNKPIIPSSLSQLVNDVGFVTNVSAIVPASNVTGLGAVATSNNYNDLDNLPDVITRDEITDGTLTIDVNNTGNLTGSVFAENGTLLVDHINGYVPAEAIFGTASINVNSPGISEFNIMSVVRLSASVMNTEDIQVEGNIVGDDSSLLIDGKTGRHFGTFLGTLNGDINRAQNSLSITAGNGITLSPNGIVNIPNATNITVNATGFVGIDATSTLRLRSLSGNVQIISSPPVNARGSAGDEIGMIAFDQSYIYYCRADYTNGLSPIWVRQAWGDTTDWV